MAIMLKRSAVLAMTLVLVVTVGAYAAPQRGGGHGGGFGGGGHMSGGGFGGGHGFNHGGGFDHGHGFHGHGGHVFVNPFFGFYPYGYFPFDVYPYADYSYGWNLDSGVKVKVEPKNAQVFVDGYYAGQVDQFDGVFQSLHVTPGGHTIALYLDGYRTVSRTIYAGPGATVTVTDEMRPLAAGEVSTPPEPPADATAPPDEQ
jgi:hypothetical protein